jgi:N utilization substance protein B
MDRLPAVDRNIMRLALFEILWSPSLDDAVAIDEALSLAKELSTDESSAYIHGVLARIASLKDGLSL